MSNPERGVVTLQVNGMTYTMRLGMNALCTLEAYLSTPTQPVTMPQILKRLEAGSATIIRAFIWAALQENHPELTVEDAGRIIMEAGGLVAFGNELKALTASLQPDPKDAQALGGGRPRKAVPTTPGTGAASTSKRAAPA